MRIVDLNLLLHACLIAFAALTGCDSLQTTPDSTPDDAGAVSDHSDRTVRVTDLISAAAIDQALQELLRLDAADSGEPIVLEVNSAGGLVSETLDFAARVRSLRSPVHTHTTTRAHALISGSGSFPGSSTAVHRAEHIDSRLNLGLLERVRSCDRALGW